MHLHSLMFPALTSDCDCGMGLMADSSFPGRAHPMHIPHHTYTAYLRRHRLPSYLLILVQSSASASSRPLGCTPLARSSQPHPQSHPQPHHPHSRTAYRPIGPAFLFIPPHRITPSHLHVCAPRGRERERRVERRRRRNCISFCWLRLGKCLIISGNSQGRIGMTISRSCPCARFVRASLCPTRTL